MQGIRHVTGPAAGANEIIDDIDQIRLIVPEQMLRFV